MYHIIDHLGQDVFCVLHFPFCCDISFAKNVALDLQGEVLRVPKQGDEHDTVEAKGGLPFH